MVAGRNSRGCFAHAVIGVIWGITDECPRFPVEQNAQNQLHRKQQIIAIYTSMMIPHTLTTKQQYEHLGPQKCVGVMAILDHEMESRIRLLLTSI